MADLNIKRGPNSGLESLPLEDGALIVTPDNGRIYTDAMVGGALTRVPLGSSDETISINLLKDAWVNNTYTVLNEKAKAENSPVISLYIPDGSTEEVINTLRYNYASIYKAEVSNGQITFYCTDTPTSNLTVLVKGLG